jgi:hypothetical protein
MFQSINCFMSLSLFENLCVEAFEEISDLNHFLPLDKSLMKVFRYSSYFVANLIAISLEHFEELFLIIFV